MKYLMITVASTLVLFAGEGSAQWAKATDKTIPRLKDGQANMSARAPRTRDGKVDLSGVWLPDNDPNGKPGGVEQMVFPRHFINITADLKPEDAALEPAADALFKQHLKSNGVDDPIAHCKPSGTPSINSIPLPYKIVQTPQLILILYEENSIFRQIFLDGRQTVKDPEPRWMGYSSGKWEGDTLVIETTGFNDKFWLDRMGHPHSDAMRVVEKLRRRDFGHLDIETTIIDPKTYKKPITYTQKTTLTPDEDLLEYFCSENEKDVQNFR